MNRVSGKDIIQAIVEDMYEGCEELRYSFLPPGIYRVYLNENDYRRLSPVKEQIIDEAKMALEEEVDKQNGLSVQANDWFIGYLKDSLFQLKEKAKVAVYGSAAKRHWKKPNQGWQISINIDPNDELEQGDLCVSSELMLPAVIELGEGNPTRNFTTIRRKGTVFKSDSAYSNFSSSPKNNSRPQRKQAETVRPSANAIAIIRYKDGNDSFSTFEMKKNSIIVGRGGIGYDVDVPLDSETKISRKHFMIRRDETDNKFYIKDLSKFGTTVNKHPLPNKQDTGNCDEEKLNTEIELPPIAEIVLADSLKIEFKALR
jgi:hypothetical protein